MPTIQNYRGIIPAIACPFTSDYRIDEPALRKLASWLATQPGVVAVMTNGHTGEVFSLMPRERAEVTRIVADELKGRLPVISSIVCEGIRDAKEHASMAREAGAAGAGRDAAAPLAALRLPPRPRDRVLRGHRRGRPRPGGPRLPGLDARLVLVGDAGAAGASCPTWQAFKVGQRDMNKYAADIKAIRAADPSKAILTCHDEYLLASMVQGVDGALVGFATFIPSLINDLWEAVKAGDLKRAMAVQDVITPLKDAVYGGGEPTGEAHARMKMGMYLAGVLDRPTVRPPTEAPNEAEMAALRAAVANAGLLKR